MQNDWFRNVLDLHQFIIFKKGYEINPPHRCTVNWKFFEISLKCTSNLFWIYSTLKVDDTSIFNAKLNVKGRVMHLLQGKSWQTVIFETKILIDLYWWFCTLWQKRKSKLLAKLLGCHHIHRYVYFSEYYSYLPKNWIYDNHWKSF